MCSGCYCIHTLKKAPYQQQQVAETHAVHIIESTFDIHATHTLSEVLSKCLFAAAASASCTLKGSCMLRANHAIQVVDINNAAQVAAIQGGFVYRIKMGGYIHIGRGKAANPSDRSSGTCYEYKSAQRYSGLSRDTAMAQAAQVIAKFYAHVLTRVT
jgi:hypothetical protein